MSTPPDAEYKPGVPCPGCGRRCGPPHNPMLGEWMRQGSGQYLHFVMHRVDGPDWEKCQGDQRSVRRRHGDGGQWINLALGMHLAASTMALKEVWGIVTLAVPEVPMPKEIELLLASNTMRMEEAGITFDLGKEFRDGLKQEAARRIVEAKEKEPKESG